MNSERIPFSLLLVVFNLWPLTLLLIFRYTLTIPDTWIEEAKLMAMDTELSAVISEIADKLSGRNLKLGVAESCTGDFLSNAITNIPGASKFFKLSVVCYSEDVKNRFSG